MAKARFYGTGRRKKSIARVYLVPGTGNITINKRNIDEYFGLETLKVVVRQPLVATETNDKFDVIVNVKGGGYTGQAGAIRHGISRVRNTVSKLHVVHHSSARDNSTEYRKRATNPENPVFSGFSLYSENLSDTIKTHENVPVTNR